MNHDPTLLAAVDAVSVRKIRSRAPGVSSQDLDYLDEEMQKNRIFPCITDPEQRTGIFERFKAIDYPIPTLGTFFPGQDIPRSRPSSDEKADPASA